MLVTENGDILYVNGKTGKYLEPSSGKANWNLLAMARPGLNHPLNEGFQQAVRQKVAVAVNGVKVGTDGGTQIVNIAIQPLAEPEPLRGMVMIAFADVPSPHVSKARGKPAGKSIDEARLPALEQELQQAREELRDIQEEMQTSLEELKSTNEELQSTNEELQSTNEQLTTSKEEMQSMNEELLTVNAELQAKNLQLMLASDDMKNLLDSTDIAILFLDEELKVRRFTAQATSIIKLIPGDAGRPITDIVSTLDYADLAQDAAEVLRTLVVQVRQLSGRDGRFFTMRIMPYRTQDNRIDGVVVTFTDISVAKNLEAKLRKAHAALKNRFKQQTEELDEERRHPPNSSDVP